MSRAIFLALGVAVGLVYALLLNGVLSTRFEGAAFIYLVCVLAMGLLGWQLGKPSESSHFQRLAMLAFAPVVFPAVLVAVLGFLIMAAVIAPIAAARALQERRRFRVRMQSKNRFATLDELRPQLNVGIGTLIEETGHQGPYRIWWTEDDVLAKGSPISAPDEFREFLVGKIEHPYNSHCLREYLDAEAGKARLTSIPPRDAHSGKLRRLFPKMRIVQVVRPLHKPDSP